jgi:serine/threonine protein kinase
MEICLTSFGISTKKLDSPLMELYGTPEYLSIEVANGDSYDERVDIWNIGVMMYELLLGVPPFGYMDDSLAVLICRIKRMEYKFLKKKVDGKFISLSLECKDLISKILVNKEERLSLEEIENHKWLKLMNEKI